MKQNLTEVLAIIDQSAESAKSSAQAINAYNALLTDLKQGGDVLWTTILFGDKVEKTLNRAILKDVKKLAKKDLSGTGKSALFDAVGKAIDELGVVLSSIQEAERPGKVIVLIGSAGKDSASKKYSLDEIKQKIEHQRSIYSWDFRFPQADAGSFTK